MIGFLPVLCIIHKHSSLFRKSSMISSEAAARAACKTANQKKIKHDEISTLLFPNFSNRFSPLSTVSAEVQNNPIPLFPIIFTAVDYSFHSRDEPLMSHRVCTFTTHIVSLSKHRCIFLSVHKDRKEEE